MKLPLSNEGAKRSITVRNLYLISHSQLGSHTIEVKASKFADWKRTVSLTGGSDVNIKAVLQPQ